MEKIALSVNELMETLGIGRATAYKLISRPDFPTAKIGSRTVIPVAGLHAWLAAGGTAAHSQKEDVV